MVKTVTVVSLSSGVLGEAFVAHELDIGLKRLRAYGLQVKFAPHALDGLETLKAHPEYRAADLLWAFRDPETDMIITAIGGDDTYRLLPYLFDHDELKKAVTHKIFLGFSDTTVNHLMLHKVGLPTFYGQAFLPDICELGPELLPYTGRFFEELITTGHIREIRPSEEWYRSREDFSPAAIGTRMPACPDHGFELLQGRGEFSGRILGGCIDTLFDLFDTGRYADSAEVCGKYALFPSLEDWKGRILLLESSEEQPTPALYRRMLTVLRETGVFSAVSGVLVGKPMDGKYHEEYKRALKEVIGDPALPIVCNLNVGHATPRCIIPFGATAYVDAAHQTIRFEA